MESHAPDHEDVSIYMAEGSGGYPAGRCGAVLRSVLPADADTAFTVVCRAAPGERGKERSRRLLFLRKFEHWFCHEFPHNIPLFSVEVVERYWQSIVQEGDAGAAGGVSGTGGACPEFAALLVHGGQYVFCGLGEWTVCDYSFQKKRVRRWYTGEERRELDRELGVPEGGLSDVVFLHGSVPAGTLYLILPGMIHPEYPKKINNRHQLKKFMQKLDRQVSFAVAVNVSE